MDLSPGTRIRPVNLPPGATLHVISEKQNYFHGPYTNADNQDHGQFWTPMVPSDSAVIELYLPAKVVNNSALELELVQLEPMGQRSVADWNFSSGFLAVSSP